MSKLSTPTTSDGPDANPRVRRRRSRSWRWPRRGWCARRSTPASGVPRGTLPTARDPDVPYRRIIAWAAMTAAAVTAADIAADRLVLRPRPRRAGIRRPGNPDNQRMEREHDE